MKILTKFNLRTSFVFSLLLASIFFTSCEDKVTTIGDDFVNSLSLPEPYVVQHLSSYNDKILSVQSNGLNNYLLGEFSDDIFGTTNTSILSQLELQTTSPDFGEDPVLDSVILTLPLFSRITGFDEDTNKDTYDLDSIFGNGSFKLQIYESNQFLRDIDPSATSAFDQNQLYYTDQLSEFQGNIFFGNPLTTINSGGVDIPSPASKVIKPSDSTFTHFVTDYATPEEIEDEDGNITIDFDTLRLSPRISIKLNKDFFQSKILDAQNSNVLVSQNSFKNYFRGLFMRIAEPQDGGAMVNLNLNSQDANIRLYYRSLRPPPSLELDEEPELEITYNTFDLRFAGNTINFYDNTSNLDLTNQDFLNGEENLYIKGGEGIVTIVDPFNGPDDNGNGIPDEIEMLRDNDWLVNEANLILYINDELSDQIDFKPLRVFVFDLDRKSVLIDYVLDPFTTNNPATSRINHLGPLEDDDGVSFYKIRLTSHINNIINNDSANTRLGVVATQNVNEARILDVRESEQGQADVFIESSISTPRGTVFYGNASDNEELRLKLQIFYTEPNL